MLYFYKLCYIFYRKVFLPMNIEEKLKILADSAKYDASCSSSGGRRKNIPNGIGNQDVSGICHSWGADR